MNLFLIFSFFHLILCQVVHPNDITIENVLEISKKRPTFIFFKPRKSNKNQNVMKLWEKLSSKYMTDKKVVIADFPCLKYPWECSSMNITSLPSIYAFYGPEFHSKYVGKYSFPVVDEWINKMSAIPVKNVTSILDVVTEIEDSTSNESSEPVKFLLTNERDYKEYYDIAYRRNSSNTYLFFNQEDNNERTNDFKYSSRITAFLNSHFSISSDDTDISLSEFIWKNQFHVPFKLTDQNIKAAKNSKEYLAIYVTKLKKNNKNYYETKLNDFNSILYKQLNFLGEKFYNNSNFCWSDIRTFPVFFKSYGIKKAPSLLVLRDDLFWTTKNADIDEITSFMHQIFSSQIKGQKLSDLKVIKYDFLRILMKYPMLIFLLLMLIMSLFVVIYFISVHMMRLRSFDRFEKELKRHPY